MVSTAVTKWLVLYTKYIYLQYWGLNVQALTIFTAQPPVSTSLARTQEGWHKDGNGLKRPSTRGEHSLQPLPFLRTNRSPVISALISSEDKTLMKCPKHNGVISRHAIQVIISPNLWVLHLQSEIFSQAHGLTIYPLDCDAILRLVVFRKWGVIERSGKLQVGLWRLYLTLPVLPLFSRFTASLALPWTDLFFLTSSARMGWKSG